MALAFIRGQRPLWWLSVKVRTIASRSFICCVAALLLAPSVAFSDGGPAVSGPNGKFSVEGAQYDDEGSFLALGSYSIPLGYSFGLQADGAVGTIDDEVMGGGGVHLFTRDPSKYLLGDYASYHTWDSIDIWRTAAEFEFYLSRVSLTGLAGYESVDVPATSNGLLVFNKDDNHFFGRADLAYNLKQVARAELDAEECRVKNADGSRLAELLTLRRCTLLEELAKEKRKIYEDGHRRMAEDAHR